MQVKVKKLVKEAKIPKYAKAQDAGLDITATSKEHQKDNIVYGTGLSIEIPSGYVGLLFPRSSLSNYDLSLSNHVGVVDSGYRGEIIFKFKPTKDGAKEYNVGDRIGQLLILPYPQVELVEAEELQSSERGTGGFGSTNNL